ncbi:MAG TPA: ComF family protein, partial [Terriglobales bacterium]|nr:ComF family protein [Terriglobales bacterium]
MLAILFPADCRLCRQPLTRLSRLPVCDACLQAIRPTDCHTCSLCGERLESQFAEGLCGMCRRIEPRFAKAAAYGAYDGGLRELIHLLKYEQVRPAARVLGRMLAEVLDDLRPSFGDTLPLIVPVPLHGAKLRERGFNQSEEIARAALKLRPGFPMSTRALVRRRATASQIGLTRAQRRANVRGAFAVMAPEQIAGRDVVLVDDVFTTGTTVSECARVLRRA